MWKLLANYFKDYPWSVTALIDHQILQTSTVWNTRRQIRRIYMFCRCDGCHMEPIEGPRFKCKTCPDFNYCETCFRMRRSHRHSFHRFEEPSSIPVNAGKAGRGKKKIMSAGLGGPEHIVKEWDRVVKSLMVSSRESQAGRLIDGTESYWQSAGSQGKVRYWSLGWAKKAKPSMAILGLWLDGLHARKNVTLLRSLM